MEQPTVLAELIKVVPVVIGAALAIVGGIIGQLMTHRLSRARDRSNLRRERLEALVKALYAHSQWLRDKQTSVLFRGQEHDAPSPLSEAQMLQKLYFPSLAPEMLAILQAQIPLIKFIGEQQLERMKNMQVWIDNWNPQPFYDAYPNYLAAIEAAVGKCRDQLSQEIEG